MKHVKLMKHTADGGETQVMPETDLASVIGLVEKEKEIDQRLQVIEQMLNIRR